MQIHDDARDEKLPDDVGIMYHRWRNRNSGARDSTFVRSLQIFADANKTKMDVEEPEVVPTFQIRVAEISSEGSYHNGDTESLF
jgi:hypothetical protein